MSDETDEPKVLEGVDVSGSPTPPVHPPIRNVRNLELLRDFIGSLSGSLDISPATQGNPDDCVRPRAYQLVVFFHDIKEKDVVAEVFIECDGNA